MARPGLKKLVRIAASIQEDATKLGLVAPFVAKEAATQEVDEQIAEVPTSTYEDERSSKDALVSADTVALFDLLITNPMLHTTTRQLVVDGHYALAVLEAFKFVNNTIKIRSGLSADGAGLMRSAFSIVNPVLQINPLKTPSQKDQQQGYMDIFAGCMTGIRNPRAHEHRYLDDAKIALEMLSLANHLLRMVDSAKRTRKSRRGP